MCVEQDLLGVVERRSRLVDASHIALSASRSDYSRLPGIWTVIWTVEVRIKHTSMHSRVWERHNLALDDVGANARQGLDGQSSRLIERDAARALEEGHLHTAGGHIHYVVGARKPG